MTHTLTVPSEAFQSLLELRPEWQAWYATRPPHIQAAIRRFPPGTAGYILGEHAWVIGYGEIPPPVGVEPSLDHVMLLFTTVFPSDDGERDRGREPQYLRRACAAHFVPRQDEE